MDTAESLDCPLGPYACQHPTALLRESERRYRKTIENAAVGIAHIGPDGSILWANRRISDILGYSREEIVKLRFQDFTHPDDLPRDVQALKEANEGQRNPYRVDKRYIRKDGSIVWSNTTVGSVRSETGEIEFIVSVIQDITEQKRMHTALAESEARFQAFQQTSPDGFLIYRSIRDDQGKIVDFNCEYANPAAAFYASLRVDQMVGHRMLEATPCYTGTGLFEVFSEVVETGVTAQAEIELELFAGNTCWFRYSAVRLDDGVAISLTDIDDRKQADIRLKKSEARFRAVQQTSPDGFVMYNSIRDEAGEIIDFRCEYANPAAAKFIRMSLDEMIGARMLEKSPLHRQSGLFDVYRKVVETGKVAKGEISLPFLMGQYGWLSYSAIKVEDGFAVSFADITSRKEAELRLRESEGRFRAVQQTSPDGFLMFKCVRSPNGDIEDFVCDLANPAAEKIIGSTIDRLVGVRLLEQAQASQIPELFDVFRNVVEKGIPVQDEREIIWDDGRKRWIRYAIVKADDGVATSFTDTTEQKLAQARLKNSEERFRAAQQTSPDGFVMARAVRDNSGEIVDFVCEFANPAAAAFSRMEQSDIIGKRFLEHRPIHKESGLFDVYKRVVETGEVEQGEIQVPFGGDEHGWLHYSAIKIEDGFAITCTDITARKKTELALQESEARLRAFQQTSPDGFIIFSSVRNGSGEIVDFRCEFANPAAMMLSHISRSDPVGGLLLKERPMLVEYGLFDIYRNVVETGETAKGEMELPYPGHDNRWVSYSAVKVADGFAISYSDITSRKKTELALQESESRLRAFVDTTPDGFMIFSSIRDMEHQIRDLRIEYVNPSAVKVSGPSANDLVGKTMSEAMITNFEIGTFDRYAEVIESGMPWQGEVHYPRSKGDFWYQVTAAKVGDGVAVSYSDVTDRKKQERQLREQDERLRSILDNVVAFVGLLSPEGILLESNEMALSAAGVERSDVIGKPFWETYWWSHDTEERDRLRDAVGRAAKGERVRYDMVIRTAGDGRMSVDFQLSPIFDENGQVIHIVPSGYDISDRKRAEQHREMLVTELSHRVKNSLATVQTIASHTLREAKDLDSFHEAFVGRLMAISKCHDLLVDTTRRNADFSQLVRDQVMPYARSGTMSQVTMTGPSIRLGAEASHAFGLVLHELATNAAKYGALSTGDGQLDINWKLGGDPTRPEAIVEWCETGGPPVSPPTRRGFGSVLIEQSLAYSLGGKVQIEYRPEGLWARFQFQKKDLK